MPHKVCVRVSCWTAFTSTTDLDPGADPLREELAARHVAQTVIKLLARQVVVDVRVACRFLRVTCGQYNLEDASHCFTSGSPQSVWRILTSYQPQIFEAARFCTYQQSSRPVQSGAAPEPSWLCQSAPSSSQSPSQPASCRTRLGQPRSRGWSPMDTHAWSWQSNLRHLSRTVDLVLKRLWGPRNYPDSDRATAWSWFCDPRWALPSFWPHAVPKLAKSLSIHRQTGCPRWHSSSKLSCASLLHS